MIEQRPPSTPPTPASPKARGRRRHRKGGSHLWDYLNVLRAHWLVSILAFLGISGFMVRSALYSTAVYQTAATIQIEQGRFRQGLMGEMAAFDSVYSVESELEVMRSHQVARRAAEDPTSGAMAHVAEEHAHRPLEVFLRPFLGRPEPTTLRVRASFPEKSTLSGYWRLRFDSSGEKLEIWREAADGHGPRATVDFPVAHALGESFTDVDRSGAWDPSEPFEDLDGDGRWSAAESFDDVDGDNRCSPGEPFEDADGSGMWEVGEAFTDLNDNNLWDPPERFSDTNSDGRRNPGDTFEDRNGNGVWDDAEPFQDRNANGVYDAGKRIEIAGVSVWLLHGHGEVEGRTFILKLQSLEPATRWVQRGITTATTGMFTGIASIGFSGPTPELSESVANALARSYIALKLARKQERAERLLAYLDTEIRQARGALRQAARARDEFVTREGAVLLSERAQSIHEQQGALKREHFDKQLLLEELSGQFHALEGDRAVDDQLVALGLTNLDARTAELVSRKTALEVTRGALLRSGAVTEVTDRVAQLEAEIAETQSQLEQSTRALVAVRRIELASRIRSVEKGIERIQTEIQRNDQLLDTLPALETGLTELSRPLQLHEANYVGLVTRQREAEIAMAGVVSSVHLLDGAPMPTGRKSPSLVRTLILAMFLASLGGLTAAALLEYLDRKIRTPAELEEGLGLDVVGSIPRYPRWRRCGVLTIEKPSSSLAETYRSLRANIKFADARTPIKSLAITSPLQGEGKTVTTVNLGVVMAQAGDRVVVVDADMRRPSTHQLLGNDREPGLVGILRGEHRWQDVIRETQVKGLHVIPAGRKPSNPGALLGSDGFRQLRSELEEEFDYVLFDVPPVLAVSDAAAFFRQLDAVYLLVRYGRYTIEVAQGAQDQIERLGANLQGAVLNAFDVRRAARGRYGYYGYYGYYQRYAEE